MLTGGENAGSDLGPAGSTDLGRVPSVEGFRALAAREHRDRTKRYVVEGARFVYSALRAGTQIEGAIVSPSLLDRSSGEAVSVLRRRGVPVRDVSRGVYHSMSAAAEPAGVAMIVRQRWSALERPSGRDAPVWVALGRVRSPGNLGTILRTALAAGAAGAIFLDHITDPYDPGAVRASMGAVLELPLVRMSPAHLGAWKRRTGALVIGSSSRGARDFRDVPRRRPTIVVLGCERHGMSRAQRHVCDITVSIPMAPGCDSLNVGVAAGILLFSVRHP